MKAADVMTPDPVCISPEASITDAIRLMLERRNGDDQQRDQDLHPSRA